MNKDKMLGITILIYMGVMVLWGFAEGVIGREIGAEILPLVGMFEVVVHTWAGIRLIQIGKNWE